MNYKTGLCYQNMSIKKLSEVPSEVAEFLELKDPHKYTSHSMRRTCATLLADGGSTALEITQFLGWKNESMAKVYVSQSAASKKKASSIIQTGTHVSPPVTLQTPVVEQVSLPALAP